MKARFITITVLSILLSSFAFGQSKSKPGDSVGNPIEISFCELMGEPDQYVDKFVRIEAVYKHLSALGSILYAECDPKVSTVAVGFKFTEDDESEEYFAKMKSLNPREKNIFIGKFIGPRKPDSKYNYGHYGWSKYQFDIYKFEKIETDKDCK